MCIVSYQLCCIRHSTGYRVLTGLSLVLMSYLCYCTLKPILILITIQNIIIPTVNLSLAPVI